MTDVLKQKIFMILVSAVLILSLIGFVLLNTSLAWFSNNDRVSANGFSLNTSVSSNLIIGKTVDDLSNENYRFSVNFNDVTSESMIAVTHDDSVADTYLKYLANNYAIDKTTGLPKDQAEPIFKPVLESEGDKYYIDFTVLLSSAFEELPVSSLEATISSPTASDSLPPYLYAASIDFYVGSVSSGNFVGTISVAESQGGGSVDLFKGNGGVVPLNTSSYITVIMRCYFDGALTDSVGNAYINSSTVGTDRVSLNVTFTAVDKSE